MAFKKGHTTNVGRKRPPFTDATRKKMSEAQKGKPTSEATKEKIRKTLSGRHYPLRQGNKNSAWKGGVSTLVRRIRATFKYRQWRSDVFTRDDFTCQDCAKRAGYLEAHHIKSFTDILRENNIQTLEEALNCEELWNINNGITLCKKCHAKTKHGRPKKS